MSTATLDQSRTNQSAVPTGYKVNNWSAYNESLVNRGDIRLWFDDDLVKNWRHENAQSKVGRPYTYSDSAMLFGCNRTPAPLLDGG